MRIKSLYYIIKLNILNKKIRNLYLKNNNIESFIDSDCCYYDIRNDGNILRFMSNTYILQLDFLKNKFTYKVKIIYDSGERLTDTTMSLISLTTPIVYMPYLPEYVYKYLKDGYDSFKLSI